MISSMQKPWSVVIEQLAELDRRQDFAALEHALKQLPSNLPEEYRATIANWQGKASLLEGKLEEALPQLALAAQLDPQRSANHYLLGAALVRQQQWLDARTALIRALQLQPALVAAHHELGWIHPNAPRPRELLLGDRPALDLLLQLRLQRLNGWYVPCEEATATQAELLESLLREITVSE